MSSAKETRLRGQLGRGVLLSIWLHAQLFVPLLILIFVYAAREEAQRAEEVDVAFRDASDEELPADLPSLDEPPPPPQAIPPAPDVVRHAEKEKKKKPKDQTKAPPPPKLAEKAPEPPKPKPEPEVAVPPLPPMPKPEIPKPQDRSHQKMVDLDNDKKDVEPPPDAKFLAQKNNRVAVETRATDTNLEKAQKGTEGSSSPSERQDQQIGDDKSKIAELEEMKSQLGRKAPDVTPHVNPELSQPETPPPPTPKSLLALRDAPRREHELTPETVDPSLPRSPDGSMSTPTDRGARGPRADAARLNKGQRMKLALSAKDFEYLFGADAQAERRLAQKERSKKVGRFQQRLGRVKSALENFIPEVKPGNQTELNTRAAPFAAFVARMHRSIHKLWGFGMLEEWDEKSGSNPYNDPNLLTTLEMVLNGDGTIDNVKVIKTSGYMPYDAAAIDVAYTAGPYPDPPREIRSKNGKIYIHWRFYRDARQCATSGVDYFILDNPPSDGDTVNTGGSERPAPSASAPGANLGDGPRHLERNPGGGGPAARAQAVTSEELPVESEPAAASSPAPAPASTPSAFPPRGDNPAARVLAQSWFGAYARGDIAAMLSQTVYPFRSTNGPAASKRSELEKMLRGLVDESPTAGRGATSVQMLTAAGLRSAIGHLPPGMDDGSGSLLFAVARTEGSDVLILILVQKGSAWKVTGLARR